MALSLINKLTLAEDCGPLPEISDDLTGDIATEGEASIPNGAGEPMP
jgi:hypothetical protein